MHDALPAVFAAILVLGIGIYVSLDGMDLGIGIVYLLAPRERDRDLMISTVGPVWDGNETWLVLGAVILYAAFPAALHVLLPALYLPLVVMLLALVLRGIAFEFRPNAVRSKRAWDVIFALASLAATLCQGLVLGTYIGVDFTPGRPTTFAFLSWFSVATAVGLVAGYALLGSAWLVWRLSGEPQAFARRLLRPCAIVVALFIVLVSVWTPLAHGDIATRWFSWPNIGFLAPIPVATVLVWVALWKTRDSRFDGLPYLLSVLLFWLGLIGLGVSVFPYAVPHRLTIWEAASRPGTLTVTGIGLAFWLPVVMSYLAFSYWTFRGKVRQVDAYP